MWGRLAPWKTVGYRHLRSPKKIPKLTPRGTRVAQGATELMMLNSRSFFIPVLAVVLMWISIPSEAYVVSCPECLLKASALGLPLDGFQQTNVSNLISTSSRISNTQTAPTAQQVQWSLQSSLPMPQQSSGLSAAAMNSATFQTSYWNPTDGFHNMAANPIFQVLPTMPMGDAPESLASYFYNQGLNGIPAAMPSSIFAPVFPVS
jgi:hypothetical protein